MSQGTGVNRGTPIYSDQELQRRRTGVQRLMQQPGLEALFISGEENFIYYIGVSGTLGQYTSFTRPAIAVIPAQGEPIAIVGGNTAQVVRLYHKDVRDYTSFWGVPVDLLVGALRDAGVRKGRVGFEAGQEQRLGMSYADFERLRAAVPEVQFVDAADLLWKMRMIKSPEETAYMKEAARITGRARQRVFDNLVGRAEGVTHRDIAREFARLMFEEGADRICFIHVTTTMPRNNTQIWWDVKLKKGDTLYLDGGAYSRAMCIDYSRLATVGKASADQRQAFKQSREINKRMMEMYKPGVKCSAVFQAMMKLHREVGADPVAGCGTTRIGHGQGMLLTEPPHIAADDHTVLEPGIVVCSEPLVARDYGLFIAEDVHVITPDGHEQLNTEPDELREL